MALQPGFKSGDFRYEVDGLQQARQVIAAMPAEVRKNARQAAARSMGTLSRRAEDIFLGSILRHQESSSYAFGGPRETGNFTFGERGTGTFVGSLIEQDGEVGFGWPDIPRADSRTNYVWRSLEFGLAGSPRPSDGRQASPPRALFSNNSGLVPTGQHRLPAKYQFTGKDPAFSVMYPGKSPRHQDGSGIEGKHFIEGAWLEVESTVGDRYKRAVIDAIGVIKKK